MSVYKQGGIYYYDVTFEGRRHRGSCKTSSVVKARAVEYEECTRLLMHEPKRGHVPTLAELGAQFLIWVDNSQSLAPATAASYRAGWRLISHQKLTRAQAASGMRALASMRVDKITRSAVDCLTVGGSPSNENCARRTLRRMLHLAEEWGIIHRCIKVPLVEEPARRQKIDALTERRIDVAATGAMRTAWVLAVDTGMRPKEIAGIAVADIDWNARCVSIRRVNTKSRNGVRTIPLSERAITTLQAHLGSRADGWVFPSEKRRGEHVRAAALGRAFSRLRRRLGIDPSVKLYGARHTFATEMMAALGDPSKVMAVMGHGDIRTTMHYQHPDLGAVAGAIRQRSENRSAPEFTPEQADSSFTEYVN